MVWLVGIVRFYTDERNMGFITHMTPTGGSFTQGEDYFVHRSALKPYTTMNDHDMRLHTGEYVEFEVDDNHRPKPDHKRRVRACRGIMGLTLQCEHGVVEFKYYTKVNSHIFPQGASPVETHSSGTISASGYAPESDASAVATTGVDMEGLDMYA
jgi:cold shock CspA family protein